MSHRENIVRIKAVHHALGDLSEQIVFVGGATVSLYADRPTSEVRPTDDVDILVELVSYGNYAQLEEKLGVRGFQNDIESGVICRYKVHGIIVDVMPTSETILGFSNKWYKEAFAEAIHFKIMDDVNIKIFKPIHFLATKLEAFKDRGGNDGRTSTDFEDVVFVLNNRNTIWDELGQTSGNVRDYLREEFKRLLEVPYIEEWIGAHLDYQEQKRLGAIMERLLLFISLEH